MADIGIDEKDLRNIFGPFDSHIKIIEEAFGTTVIERDGAVKILGDAADVARCRAVMDELYEISQRGNDITEQQVRYSVEMHMEKPEERDLIRNYGIWPGLNFRKIMMGVQPPCLLGITMHHMDILFEIHPQPDRKQVTAFIQDHAPLVKQLVYERLQAKGINPAERIDMLRRINEDEWEHYGPEAHILNDLEERRINAIMADMPSIALKSYPNSVPLYDHKSLSRDGRPLLPEMMK